MSELHLVDKLPNGITVSTVYLGTSYDPHGVSGASPARKPFETAVFAAAGIMLFDRGYHTEEKARKGHAEVCRMYRKEK